MTDFTLTTGGGGNDAVSATLTAGNGTSVLYVDLQNPANIGDVLTIHIQSAGVGS